MTERWFAMPDGPHDWVVRWAGAGQAVSRHAFRDEAIEAATDLARHHRHGGEVLICQADGTIREQLTVKPSG